MKFFFCGGSNLIWHFVKEENRFPNIVSNYFNANPTIVGLNGGSNKRTIRQIFYEYDMNEYDFIFVDFTPPSRTEFYNDKTNNWEGYVADQIKVRNHTYNKEKNKRINLYYQYLYNSEYGLMMENINFMTIKKYLTALNKPHILMSSYKNSKDTGVPYDYHINDYEISADKAHLSGNGHRKFAEDIIKRYENILQR